ncbi:MAG: hemolysin III family protein [Ruminococcaceae bacterium]|nr:hemolysin III family protein [Oscillospiraceae bacterium]
MRRTKLADRKLPDYTRGEEIFNFVSHTVGGAFAIIALILCIGVAAYHGNVWGIVSGSIYGVTMILLYCMSSIYHGLIPVMAKKVFQVLDHCTIYLLIAGTYTPITLVAFRSTNPVLGWSVFGIIWFFAILGITLTAIDWKKYNVFSMICYLGMGWCAIFLIKDLIKIVGTFGTVFLLLGGILYTIGAILYAFGHKVRYFHSVFHLFVIAGSVMHFIMILVCIMPM